MASGQLEWFVVPPSGLVGRVRPDASLPPARSLPPGTPLRVVRTLGAWAEVAGTDGWTGWVDGRRLLDAPVAAAPAVAAAGPAAGPAAVPGARVPGGYPSYAALHEAATAPAPAAPAPAGGSLLQRVPIPALVGAGLLVVSAVLPWIRSGGRSRNAFDIPVQFLVDFRTTATGSVDIGLTLVTLAIGALVLSARPGLARWRRVCGGAAIVVATLYTAQIQRVLNDMAAADRPTLFGTLGLGVLTTIVGGALVLWGGPRRSPR